MTGNPFLRSNFYYFSKLGIINNPISDMDSYLTYIRKHFLEDFYPTDAWKFRKKRGFLRKHTKTIKNKNIDWLTCEIVNLNPRIIISFSKLAWDLLNKIYPDIRPLFSEFGSTKKTSRMKISDVQGHLFECQSTKVLPKCLYLPLSHFSSNNAKRFSMLKNLDETSESSESLKYISEVLKQQ